MVLYLPIELEPLGITSVGDSKWYDRSRPNANSCCFEKKPSDVTSLHFREKPSEVILILLI